MQGCCWAADEGGALTSEVGPCRLTVATIGGMTRFLVHRREPDASNCFPSLLESGTRPNAALVMAAAEAAAVRIATVAGTQPRAGR